MSQSSRDDFVILYPWAFTCTTYASNVEADGNGGFFFLGMCDRFTFIYTDAKRNTTTTFVYLDFISAVSMLKKKSACLVML